MKRDRIPSQLSPEEKWMTVRALESVERALYRQERGLPSESDVENLNEIVPQPWIARRERYLKGRVG